jgi:choline kinase
MVVIILAAGIGSRLYPLTKNTPKCLLKVNERTLLEENLATIESVDKNIEKIIVVGFEHEKILNALHKYSLYSKLSIVRNPFYDLTNSIASLWLVMSAMNITDRDFDNYVIINADVYFNRDVFADVIYSPLQNFVICDNSKKCSDADYKIVTYRERVSNMGKIVPFDKYYGEYAGITKLNFIAWNHLVEEINKMMFKREYGTWYETALVNLIKKKKLNLAYINISTESWDELDSLKDLIRIRKTLKSVVKSNSVNV